MRNASGGLAGGGGAAPQSAAAATFAAKAAQAAHLRDLAAINKANEALLAERIATQKALLGQITSDEMMRTFDRLYFG
jgi:hypothetical protein